MARPLRLEHAGAVWHVHNRGNNRADIFFCDEDRLLFLALLEETVRRYHWSVIQYVLMTNHFHLMVETPEPTLSRGMKWLCQVYAQRLNRRHGRSGHLFGSRFTSHLVEKNAYLLETLRYLALNPVRAGIVARPEDYRWGSHRAAAGLERVPAWLQTRWTLEQFGSDRTSQRREYRKFVDAGGGIERAPWENAIGRIFVGSAQWVEEMRGMLEGKPRSSDHPAMQRYAARPRPARVVEAVAEVFETTPEAIRAARGTRERRVVAWLGCYESMARLGAIAATLRLRSTSRVSALIAECDQELARDALLRAAVDRCLEILRRDLVRVATIHREHYPSVAMQA